MRKRGREEKRHVVQERSRDWLSRLEKPAWLLDRPALRSVLHCASNEPELSPNSIGELLSAFYFGCYIASLRDKAPLSLSLSLSLVFNIFLFFLFFSCQKTRRPFEYFFSTSPPLGFVSVPLFDFLQQTSSSVLVHVLVLVLVQVIVPIFFRGQIRETRNEKKITMPVDEKASLLFV